MIFFIEDATDQISLLMLLIIRSRKAALLSDISFFGSFIFRFS